MRPSQHDRSLSRLAKEITDAAERDGFALQNIDLTRSGFASLVHEFGSLSARRFGTGEAGFLELDASPLPNRVVTGQSALPLHTDGALVGSLPRYIVLYCHDVSQPPGSGRTEVCLQSELLAPGTPDEYSALITNEWEYFVTDESHFPDVANRWMSIPTIVPSPDGVMRLNLALPFADGDGEPGWRVRLPGLTEDGSRSRLLRLDDHLRRSASYYSHDWVAGDLLVLDNHRVLHGRSRIEPGSVRHLLRGQIDG